MQKTLGIKLAVIGILALVLLIPIGMIGGKIQERETFREAARASIAESWTGEQVIFSPVMAIPYVVEESRPVRHSGENDRYEQVEVERQRLIVPADVMVTAEVATERRRRGIYSFPVYTSRLHMQGSLPVESLDESLQAIRDESGFVRLRDPFFTLGVADARGITGAPVFRVNGNPVPLLPGTGIHGMNAGVHAELDTITEGPLQFEVNLELRGMGALDFIPIGLASTVITEATWPHPEFNGAFLPLEHAITAEGFTARWQTNQFSTDINNRVQACIMHDCQSLDEIRFGVRFNEGVDIYLQAERASKYGILFVSLTFIVFFMFEILKQCRIHPIQYALVGMAITLFYLLLVSLGEHLPFALSYWCAAAACIALLTYYIRYVLQGWHHAGFFAALFVSLYGLLFIIIRAEDFALLMGSLLIFAVLAGIMVVTRKFDWFELQVPAGREPESVA